MAESRALSGPPAASTGRHVSPWQRVVRRFLHDRAAVAGAAILLVVIALSLFPNWFSAYDPTRMNSANQLLPPAWRHPLGTDELGRDVWSRVAHGTRVSLLVSLAGVGAAMLSGALVGVGAAFIGRKADNLVMRAMDVLFAFPAILLALMIMTGLGAGTVSVIIALAVVYSPRFARVARGATLVAKEELYVESARAIGAPEWRIVGHHVLPNIAAPLIVQFSVSMGFAVIVEASLSFLGMGLQPPHPSWGYMLAKGKDFMEVAPWVVIGPGLALMLTVVGFNLLGDGLRDIMDPRLREERRGV